MLERSLRLLPRRVHQRSKSGWKQSMSRCRKVPDPATEIHCRDDCACISSLVAHVSEQGDTSALQLTAAACTAVSTAVYLYCPYCCPLSLSITAVCCCLLLPTVAYCCPLSLLITAAYCCLLLPTVAYCCPLSLSITAAYCCLLLPTVAHGQLVCPCIVTMPLTWIT